MEWIERARQVLFSHSKEKRNFNAAVLEWHYTGNCFDLEKERTNCQLCEHPDIRYQFEVSNTETDAYLYVGSECINKFDIRTMSSAGSRDDSSTSRHRVTQDKNRLINNARDKRIVTALVALKKVDLEFEIDSFIDYLRDRGAFTPNQLKFIFWRFKEQNIDFLPRDYKLTIRRNREKEQLRSLKDWQVRQLWEAMSDSQREWYLGKMNQ